MTDEVGGSSKADSSRHVYPKQFPTLRRDMERYGVADRFYVSGQNNDVEPFSYVVLKFNDSDSLAVLAFDVNGQASRGGSSPRIIKLQNHLDDPRIPNSIARLWTGYANLAEETIPFCKNGEEEK